MSSDIFHGYAYIRSGNRLNSLIHDDDEWNFFYKSDELCLSE
jgi:hypothetical protein